MPSTSRSCEYCGTMVMLLPAAAEVAKASIAALSSAAMPASPEISAIAEARGTGFSHSLPKA